MEVELTFQGMSPCCSVSQTNVQVYLRVGFSLLAEVSHDEVFRETKRNETKRNEN